MTYYKATRPDGTDFRVLGELLKNRLYLRVVRSHGSPLTQVAGSTREAQVVEAGFSSGRPRNQVVDVENAILAIEELQDPSLGDRRPFGPFAAVMAEATIALCDFISKTLRDKSFVFSHTGRLAKGSAVSPSGIPATRDLIGTGTYTQEHHDLLYGPWEKVMGK